MSAPTALMQGTSFIKAMSSAEVAHMVLSNFRPGFIGVPIGLQSVGFGVAITLHHMIMLMIT
jgi:uncharacterized membrane protein (DUF485 family)